MDDFIAHVKNTSEGDKIQTVFEHCVNVSERAEKYGASIGVGSLAKLAGLVHDFGKLRNL